MTHVLVPEIPTSLLCIILTQLAEGKLGTVKEGSLEFALSIARRYHELGGQITYGAAVQEIVVEPRARGRRCDRAVGVRLADGSEHRADAVVSAADGHSTIFEMLDGRYADRRIRERYKTWPTFTPIVTVSYGVGRPYAEPTANLIRLQDPIAVAGQKVEHLLCRIHRGSAFAPQGKTVVQALFETDYDYWYDLQRDDRARYEAEKERVADQVLDRLERHLPGISSSVEMTDVATPYTLWRYTRNYRGAFEGWLITTENSGKPLPKTLPGLEDFYMAGQWVEPGGGVPVALRSGRQVVQLLCHRDRVPFSVSVSEERVTTIDSKTDF
jgi:phytoene dehydrogenase-like protein